MDDKTRAFLEAERGRMERQAEIANEITAKDPRIPDMTAFVMAGDALSAERASADVERGIPAETAYVVVGSYNRFGWALDWCRRDWFLDRIADLWRGADPDDTDPRFLAVWREAFQRNGGTVLDGKPLPARKTLTVYRGQFANDPLGIAWSLSSEIAYKFAAGAGIRSDSMLGVVLAGDVERRHVLGYLTGRHEEEIVVNPNHIKRLRIVRQRTPREVRADRASGVLEGVSGAQGGS